jgi:hypothetical protein
MSDEATNPCTSCGACCAFFRVSFYWSEAETRGIPESMTEQVNAVRSCMAGTGGHPVRCVALNGTVGEAVHCTMYEQRPTPCRSVLIGDEKCNRARERYGLPPIH